MRIIPLRNSGHRQEAGFVFRVTCPFVLAASFSESKLIHILQSFRAVHSVLWFRLH